MGAACALDTCSLPLSHTLFSHSAFVGFMSSMCARQYGPRASEVGRDVEKEESCGKSTEWTRKMLLYIIKSKFASLRSVLITPRFGRFLVVISSLFQQKMISSQIFSQFTNPKKMTEMLVFEAVPTLICTFDLPLTFPCIQTTKNTSRKETAIKHCV